MLLDSSRDVPPLCWDSVKFVEKLPKYFGTAQTLAVLDVIIQYVIIKFC